MGIATSSQYKQLRDRIEDVGAENIPCVIQPTKFDAVEELSWPVRPSLRKILKELEETSFLCHDCPALTECSEYAMVYGELFHGVVAGRVFLEGNSTSMW